MVSIEQISQVSKQIMDRAYRSMKDDLEASYYVADDAIDKLDKLVTAYGKQTGSKFINHKNFVLVAESNGIVNMHALRDDLRSQLDDAKKSANVDEAIKVTQKLDHIGTFDFTFKYGEDTLPATNFYSGSKDEQEMPQLDEKEVIKDIIYSNDNYTVGPDVMYLFMTDFRKNVLPEKEA